MNRREFNLMLAGAGIFTCLTPTSSHAFGLADLSNREVDQGVKTALEQGAIAAVGLLGRPDGFLGNPKVRIPLPGILQQGAGLLKAMGRGQQIEELEVAMNRAAEAAVPMAKEMLVNAARSITVNDARGILTGGETSVTDFFAGKTREPLTIKFLPVVKTAIQKVGLAQKYNAVAGKIAGTGLVGKQDANLEHYVTGKSLDGLYFMIGEEEKKIRSNPAAAGSAVLRKVFGALK
ncbi:DUF4197 domain-containing protein [Ramlibacter sp. AW1]|uniref:DUF4197 domain-containing protein n=1 Tax=Ramlibacter aurantiacus TaxID=2801330 RepID=A0A937D7Y7_9BURK|nr:DUF4197 domain-containing protein [Ramlibacter aurantiacus]MBL0422498.1 DUF4197 domain-containing protein [Ramlibacter aurantiacus]